MTIARPSMSANRCFFLSFLALFIAVHTRWSQKNYIRLGGGKNDYGKEMSTPATLAKEEGRDVLKVAESAQKGTTLRKEGSAQASKNVTLTSDTVESDVLTTKEVHHKSNIKKSHTKIKKKIKKKSHKKVIKNNHKKMIKKIYKKRNGVPRTVAADAKDGLISKNVSTLVVNNNNLTLDDIDVDIDAIVEKWNLTSSNAAALLQQQAQRSLSDYDENRDFIYLHHLPKTAGTTISIILDQLFKPYVLPGSGKSTYFRFPKAEEILNVTTEKERLRYKVSFSHNNVRPTVGPEQTRVAEYLRSVIPSEKKLRLMTVVREPVAHRASYHAMIVCGLNLMVRQHNRERERQGLEAQCGFELNLTDVVDSFIEEKKRLCKKGETSKYCTGNYSMCYSARNYLFARNYKKNMFKPIMGQLLNDTYSYPPLPVPFDNSLVSKVEDYTLRDLGGLFPNKSGNGEADFLWFGVTERMTESLCLLYYTLRISDFPKTVPTAHFNSCRPLSWWSEEEKNIARKGAVWDNALWRAGNAILDVRMAKMKAEIRAALRQGITLEDIPYVAPGCFE